MAGYLIAEEGPLAGVIIRFENETEWILGRDPDDVSIVLEDPMVSRRHVICRLTQRAMSGKP
jgi:pSer/pThr/pTyr-binding forkhead associated (FHA) protein